ncbi:hypothetical protein [Kitasatospora sp. NPDC085879]|uniref:hypothetical protein n=1 Tax=Kitasatospora sp. NPDC085879 TaxID=3154769 RepID=UPI0034463D0E
MFIVHGEYDRQANTPESAGPLLHFSVPDLYAAIPGPHKLMVRIACAGRSMVWERKSKVLRRISRQWLDKKSVEGLSSGSYHLDEDGVLTPAA